MMALIMAGGAGTRFWPKSRERYPKQLLPIIGDSTMLQSTVNRLQPLVPPEKTFVVCKETQQAAVRTQLPALPPENIIVEPCGKNTAPCIGLAALHMRRRYGDEVMVVLPADHFITPEDRYRDTLRAAGRIAAEQPVLITIGIPPTFPATGYGYIQFGDQEIRAGEARARVVKTFAEKPNLETARLFLESGDFLWNSGMFVWRVSTIMHQLEEHLPDLVDGLEEIDQHVGRPTEREILGRVYQQIKSISIDYGVMEHARNVVVLQANFNWNDVGSWDEVHRMLPKDERDNALCGGDHAMLDSSGCLVDVAGKTVAVVGIRDLIVVETEDALLLCARDSAQKVKELVEILKRKKKTELL